MDVEASILGAIENAWGDEQTKGDGDYEVYWNRRGPSRERVDFMGRELQFLFGYLLNGY